MNPAAVILRRAQDSMRLADCAHGTGTQLTGHIIARRSTPPESGSWSGWRSLGPWTTHGVTGGKTVRKTREDRDARADTLVLVDTSATRVLDDLMQPLCRPDWCRH